MELSVKASSRINKPFVKIGFLHILCIAILLPLVACQNAGFSLHSQSRDNLLGTVITISSYDKIPADVLEECFASVKDIEDKMSVNIADSEVARLNTLGQAQVSDELYQLIQKAVTWAERSDGAFDITIGSVMELWKNGSHFSRLPSKEEIESALPFVGYQKIKLAEGNQISLENGTRIDLGGIAKGFACDRSLEILKAHDIRNALLNFGGNIYALGTKADGSPWRIGIQNPISGESGHVCIVDVSNKTVVTSGGYERFFEENGELYHHIFDPKTGSPVKNGLLSASIVTDCSADADALSTLCFVLGLEKAIALLEGTPNCEGIFITEQRIIYATSGLQGKLVLTNSTFTISEDAA